MYPTKLGLNLKHLAYKFSTRKANLQLDESALYYSTLSTI